MSVMDDPQPMAYCRKDMNLRHPVGECPYDYDPGSERSAMNDDPQARQRASEARWSATPDALIANGTEMRWVKPPPPAIAVVADDGTELLRIQATEDGRLDVTGPEDRWTEGAARFVAEMRRMLIDENWQPS